MNQLASSEHCWERATDRPFFIVVIEVKKMTISHKPQFRRQVEEPKAHVSISLCDTISLFERADVEVLERNARWVRIREPASIDDVLELRGRVMRVIRWR